MEDVDSPETRAWVEAQAKLTSDYLAAIPGREHIAERLKQIWNYERWSPPEKHGPAWFYDHNDGLQNQSVLYTMDAFDGAARQILDPNALSRDGTVAFKGAGYSDDGRLMAYGLSEAGSDWETWRVRDLATGKDLADEIHHAKFTQASWRKDGSGFYYAGYEVAAGGESLKAQNQFHTLYFHRLGTPQAADELVYRRSDDPNWQVGAAVSDDGRYLVVQSSRGTDTRNVVLVADLGKRTPLRPVIPEPTASYSVIGNLGTRFYVLTDAKLVFYKTQEDFHGHKLKG